MKNTNKCPKCGGEDIVRIDGYGGEYTANQIRAGFFFKVNVNRYLCCSCGFSEEWIDEEDLQVLKDKYAE